MIRFHNFDLLHHFSGLCIVLLLLVGYLIIGIFALAWLLVKCLHECFKLISALLEWDMDHIIGLSTEMNLNWINIPLSIAFSLNVLHLKNMGFSFLRIWHSWANLLRVIRIKVAFTSSLPDFPWGSCYSNDPPHPSPPPPLSINFPWSALYTLLSTTYIPYIPPLENHLILSKSFKTHPLTQAIKITTGRFGQMIWRYCLIDANCLTGNQFFLWYWRSSAKLFRASSKRYLSFLLSFQQSC